MSRGCPVIGTSIAGIPELVQEQFLFKKGSEKDFVKALQRILRSDLSEIATENFEKARKYEKNNLKEKRKRFYDQFLSDIDKLK
jgi:glycosyltransferase involved in cell wall biosynthesis